MSALVALAVLKLTLRLELGPEWDSNANRAEIVQGAAMQTDVPTSSFLVRSTARGGLAVRTGRNLFRLSGLLGGKVFFNPAVSDQNMIVGQLGVEDRLRVHRAVELGVSGDYYDVAQMSLGSCPAGSCNRHRDFRNGSALLRLSFFDDPGQLTLSGGYRGFQWKPDPAFDFHAGQLNAVAGMRLYAGPAEREHEIDLTAAYHLERRAYQGAREINICPPGTPIDPTRCLTSLGQHRSDWFHEALVDVTYVKVILLSLTYAAQLNQSDSFGQSLLRHIVTLKFSSRLFWQLYLTLKGQLMINRYLDPVLLDRQVNSQTFISIEEENRNAFVADLERPIGRTGLAVGARYSVYTNELSRAPASFLRHVVYLGLSYQLNK